MADKNKKIISPIQARIDKAQLELEKKRVKNGKEIKTRKHYQEPLPLSGMRRFNRGGKV